MSKYEPKGFKLKVKRSRTGLGLFAEEDISKEKCILEYFGRVLTEREQYTCRSKYLFEINSKVTIDGSDKKNIARYINHSCKPNCEARIYKDKAFIFSIKNIKEGEELFYDYGEEYFDEHIKKHGCK
jgi:SET domain-containing protein